MTAPKKEQFKNASQSSLNGGIDASQTTITVTDGSQFPSVGNFRLIIDDELMLGTARSGNDLTVVRGSEGTTPASHSNGAAVPHIITVGGDDSRGRQNEPLWESNRPAYGVWNDAGDAPLVASDFTDVNLGGGDSKTDQGQTILLRKGTQAGHNITALVRTAPSTPYAYITALRGATALSDTSADVATFGMCFRESSTGKLIQLFAGVNSVTSSYNFFIGLEKWTDHDSFSAAYKDLRAAIHLSPEIFFKLEDDGTNLKFFIGMDGFNWIQLHSVSRTDFMAGGPDQVGISANNSNNQNNEMLVRLVHWSKE